MEPTIALELGMAADGTVRILGVATSGMSMPSIVDADGVYQEVDIDPHGAGPYRFTVKPGRIIAPHKCWPPNQRSRVYALDQFIPRPKPPM